MLIPSPTTASLPNPFMAGVPIGTHRTGRRGGRQRRYDPSILREYGSRGEQCRFLRESGLELSDFGLLEWAEIDEHDRDVQLHQAIHGRHDEDDHRGPKPRSASSFVSSHQFRLGYDAIACANVCGGVMNVMISISWSTVGIVGTVAVVDAHQRYLELLRKALQRRRLPVGWVWVIENGPKWGLHSHILLTMPHAKKDWLKFQIEEAITTIAGRPPVRQRGTRTVHVHHRRDHDVVAQWKLFRYMMKGLKPERRPRNPEHRVLPRLQDQAGLRLEAQGLVEGKRFGTSRNLGEKAISLYYGDGFLAYLESAGPVTPVGLFTDEWYEVWRSERRKEESKSTEAELLTTLHI